VWIGHEGPIRLLDGGIQGWKRQGFSLSNDEEKPPGPALTYTLNMRPEVAATIEDIRHASTGQVLIDTRSLGEWFFGHLPGAVHLPWKKLVQGKDRAVISREAYQKLLSEKGVHGGRRPIFYCTGGIRSAYVWVVHQLYGSAPGKNFEGGTSAWKRGNF
jgi:thiosulfate/3-mercaptopyruvate sulfurtransferase